MGMKGKEIVEKAGVNVPQLLKMLNKAYSDEWLAYYQYWVGAKVAAGVAAPKLTAEMEEHAADELDHAAKLAKRIVELDGTPVLSPEEWYKQTNCGYLVPANPESKIILAQNLQSERCAIDVYVNLLDFVKGKDLITEHLIREILEDEVEHEHDLEDIGIDIADVAATCGCAKK